MQDLVLIVLMMAVTFGVRYPVLALVGRINISPAVKRALAFVPVAVLSALSAPIVAINDGQWNVSFDNEYLVASVVAIAIAWKTRHLMLTIIIGMLVFMLLRLFG